MNQIKIPQYSNYPIPYLNIENYQFDKKLFGNFTREELIEFEFIPLDQFNNILTVCVCNPSLDLIKSLEKHTNKIIRIFWCEEVKLMKMINKLISTNNCFYEETEIQWKG